MLQYSRKKILIALLILAVLSVLYFAVSYNRFIDKEEKVTTTYNNLQARYQRRFDLIPMLVSVVKASSDYEQKTLIQLTEIRASAGNLTVKNPSSANVQALEGRQADFANTFNRILAVVENYPEIQSQKNYLLLQAQIKGTENRIKVARADFNEAVKNYNIYVRSFPSSVVAKVFGFKAKEGFFAEDGAAKSVEIKF
ncbi:MAG: LemA family protein [Niabella sp.]